MLLGISSGGCNALHVALQLFLSFFCHDQTDCYGFLCFYCYEALLLVN